MNYTHIYFKNLNPALAILNIKKLINYMRLNVYLLNKHNKK